METVTWAKGTAITPKGEVWVSWNKHTDGTAEITVHGPEDGADYRQKRGII